MWEICHNKELLNWILIVCDTYDDFLALMTLSVVQICHSSGIRMADKINVPNKEHITNGQNVEGLIINNFFQYQECRCILISLLF